MSSPWCSRVLRPGRVRCRSCCRAKRSPGGGEKAEGGWPNGTFFEALVGPPKPSSFSRLVGLASFAFMLFFSLNCGWYFGDLLIAVPMFVYVVLATICIYNNQQIKMPAPSAT